jgi:hypothetical protein
LGTAPKEGGNRVRKRFDKELYDQYDKLAKDATISLVNKRIYDIKENLNKRSVDLLVYSRKTKELVFYIETEVKRLDWKNSQFKYDTVQLPERKKKFCNLEVPTIFVVWNKDQTAYITFTDKEVMKAPLVEVPNKYMFKDEYFFQIPIKKCVQGSKKDKLKL